MLVEPRRMDGNPQSLRILQVSTADRGGGAERSAWQLFEAYRARRITSWLAVGHRFSDDPDVIVIPNEEHRSRWVRFWRSLPTTSVGGVPPGIPWRLRKLAWLGELRRYTNILRGIEDLDYPGTWHLLRLCPAVPSVVHCHNLHGNYFDLRALPALSQVVPVILNVRDSWLLTGHCACPSSCERWRSGCGECPDLSLYPSVGRDNTAGNWKRKRSIYEKSRFYVTTASRWMMSRVEESMLAPAAKRVIPNGIDVSVFRSGDRSSARELLKLPLRDHIVLFVIHSSFRDYQTARETISGLCAQHPDGIKIIIVGWSGNAPLFADHRVTHVEFVRSPETMARYYQAADIYVHAARYEPFGNTVTEAMACGIPVVATAVGGISEQVEDGVTGFLVPGRDSAAIVKAVGMLLASRELRSRMGTSASAHVRRAFSLDRQVESFIGWYREVIADWQQWKASDAATSPDPASTVPVQGGGSSDIID